jgi:tetratricopeptide (TPR) repeat protein
MLYSRFTAWNLPPKYNAPARRQALVRGDTISASASEDPDEGHSTDSPASTGRPHGDRRMSKAVIRLHSYPSVEPSPGRALPASATYTLRQALSAVGQYLDEVVGKRSWLSSVSQPRVDFQRLVASANLAATSQSYDTHGVWKDLRALEPRARQLMSTYANELMPPRVFPALLRLLVQGWNYSEQELKAFHAVKCMFWIVSQTLPKSHPLRLLCSLSISSHQAPELLNNILKQLKVRYYDRISDESPDFAASEQIYSARCLASLGRTDEADELLDSVKQDLRARIDYKTMAEYCSTVGYSKYHAKQLEDARKHMVLALYFFKKIGKEYSESCTFVHRTLAELYHIWNNLSNWQHHAEEALACWGLNTTPQNNQGGVLFVRDLHQVYQLQNKTQEMQELESRYPDYFVESPDDGSMV